MLTEVRQIQIQILLSGAPMNDAGGKCMRLCLRVQMVLQAVANCHHFLCYQKNCMGSVYPQVVSAQKPVDF